jgi:pre-60S factor REI1
MTLPCNTCRLRFATREGLLTHYKTDLHRTNLVLQSRHQQPLSVEQYEAKKAEEDAKEQPAGPPPPEPPPPPEEEDVSKLDVAGCVKIPPDECFFCGRHFETPELALEHMGGHGFRFCYPAQLVDPAGLMHYFSEKIGIGHSCMLCNRQFRSIAAVRDHMEGKCHCAYEFDDEYSEFYAPETAIMPANFTVDKVGELHINGKVYGHRMYRRYYKQRLTDPEDMKRMARIPIAGPMAPRESITLDRDAVARKREFYKQKYISKRQRRLVSKNYHPFSDIHRGNA